MEVIIEFIIDGLVGWVAKRKGLSVCGKTVLVFLVLNLLTIAMVIVAVDLWSVSILGAILAIALAAIWFAIFVVAIIRGHKSKWIIE